MSIILDKCTGYGKMAKMIVYVAFNHAAFRQNGSMKLFDGDFSKVVDVSMSKTGTITVHYYPHNDINFVETYARTNETSLAKIISVLQEKSPGRGYFTLIFEEKGIREITTKDFSRYHPSREPVSEMFIFEVEPEEGGFPTMYVMEKGARIGPYEFALPIFAASSHDITDPVNVQTNAGKELIWCLYNSWFHGKFEPTTPTLGHVSFPTNGYTEIPKYLNSKKLKEWGEKIGSSLRRSIQGDVEGDAFEPRVIDVPAQNVVTPSPKNPFGEVDGKMLETWVSEGIKKSGSINLTDICALTLSKALEMVENPDNIISIQLDTAISARKMCIYKGQIHYVPTITDFDPVDFFGEDSEMFVKCNDETFPRYLLPSPKE